AAAQSRIRGGAHGAARRASGAGEHAFRRSVARRLFVAAQTIAQRLAIGGGRLREAEHRSEQQTGEPFSRRLRAHREIPYIRATLSEAEAQRPTKRWPLFRPSLCPMSFAAVVFAGNVSRPERGRRLTLTTKKQM